MKKLLTLIVLSFAAFQLRAQLTLTTSQTNVSCNGGCNGTAIANPTGGTTPYTYSWAPSGATSQNVSNLCAGVYTVTVTDAAFATATATVNIAQPLLLTQTLSSTMATCSFNNGTASSTPSGGTPPYAYVWGPNPVEYTQTATNLIGGTYTCVVTDANGCTATNTVNVMNASGPTASISSFTNVDCNGNCNGTASVQATGGALPYTCTWTNVVNTSLTNQTGLCAGNYSVYVTDANGCVSNTVSITLTQPSSISIATSSTSSTCGNPTGTATATPSGGTPPYQYDWNTIPVQTSSTATGLVAGTYTVTVTDSHLCTATAFVAVANLPGPSTAIASYTNVSCFGGNDGSATVTVLGGTSPYTYAWTPSAAITPTIAGVVAGNYACTVTDANNCTSTASVVITEPPAVTVSVSSFVPAGCNNADGSANAIASGGVGSYVYSWAPSGSSSSNAVNLPNTATHTVTVTDANGCTATATVTIGDSCNYVWPGDANEDAVADNNDILSIGIANGATGTTRASATTNWIGQPSADWGQTFLSGTDYKFADCDGNGTINNTDTNAVIQNFGFTHNMRLSNAPVYDATLPDLTVTLNQSQIGSGNPGSLSVALGNSSMPLSNVYGVAFTLNFDPALIDASSFGMNNSNCWMGTVGNDLMGVVLRPSAGSGFVQVAITRFDHNNANGFGNIADLGFMTTSAFMGTFQNQDVIFSISNATIISANETTQQVNMVNDTVNVCDPGVLGFADSNEYSFSAFPNPAKEELFIAVPSGFQGKNTTITLTDAAGRIVSTQQFSSTDTYHLQMNTVESGIYFCNVLVEGRSIGVKKVVIE